MDQQAYLLGRIAAPVGDQKRLDDQVATSIRQLADHKARLNTARITLANESADLLALYQTLHEAVTRRLEQTIHGSVARGTRTQADYLAKLAQDMEKKLRVMELQIMQQVYSEEVKEGIVAKERALAKENVGLSRRV